VGYGCRLGWMNGRRAHIFIRPPPSCKRGKRLQEGPGDWLCRAASRHRINWPDRDWDRSIPDRLPDRVGATLGQIGRAAVLMGTGLRLQAASIRLHALLCGIPQRVRSKTRPGPRGNRQPGRSRMPAGMWAQSQDDSDERLGAGRWKPDSAK
jgi:hypothetical protein